MDEKSKKEVIQKNVEMLISDDFFNALWRESVGGNAGENCACVNAIVDKRTGEIVDFSNQPIKDWLNTKAKRKGIKGEAENYDKASIIVDLSYTSKEKLFSTNIEDCYPKITKLVGAKNYESLKRAVEKANEIYRSKIGGQVKKLREEAYKK